MSRSPVALTFVLAGVVLLVIGLLAWAGALSWFGHLPGDIRIERPTARVYIPIGSMVVVSVILSLVMAVARRLFR